MTAVRCGDPMWRLGVRRGTFSASDAELRAGFGGGGISQAADWLEREALVATGGGWGGGFRRGKANSTTLPPW